MKKLFILLILILSYQTKVFAISDSLLLSCFYQTEDKNCASVALIKAAMYKYSYNHVFEYSKTNNGYNITLKNGQKLEILESERLLLIKMHVFEISDEVAQKLGPDKDSVIFYIYLYYSAIAKYINTYGYWLCEDQKGTHIEPMQSYIDAVKFITDESFCVDYCYRLLGLSVKGNVINNFRSPSDVDKPGIILYGKEHAVVTYKNFLDCHGDWENITLRKVCNNKFKWYIELN